MFDLSHLFVSAALAQDAAAGADGSSSSSIVDIASPQTLMMLSIFLVFYFLVIRPQQKKLAEQDKMIKALQRGDRVIIVGGIHGKITKLEEATLMIEIASGVEIKVERASVQGLEAKPQPANDTAEKK